MTFSNGNDFHPKWESPSPKGTTNFTQKRRI